MKKLEKAINYLLDALDDDDYKNSWVANIAMSYIDAEHWYKKKYGKKFLNNQDKLQIASDAALNFLNILDTRPKNIKARKRKIASILNSK